MPWNQDELILSYCSNENQVKILGSPADEIDATDKKQMRPFYITFVDLFGPIQIKDTIKKRCRGKAYVVIFSCGSCRGAYLGAYLDASDGYDTDNFLLELKNLLHFADGAVWLPWQLGCSGSSDPALPAN